MQRAFIILCFSCFSFILRYGDTILIPADSATCKYWAPSALPRELPRRVFYLARATLQGCLVDALPLLQSSEPHLPPNSTQEDHGRHRNLHEGTANKKSDLCSYPSSPPDGSAKLHRQSASQRLFAPPSLYASYQKLRLPECTLPRIISRP